MSSAWSSSLALALSAPVQMIGIFNIRAHTYERLWWRAVMQPTGFPAACGDDRQVKKKSRHRMP